MNKRKLLTNKKEILAWLKSYSCDENQTYEITHDLNVRVNGHLIINKKIDYLPVNFEWVSEDFHCEDNNLVSLEGCPQKVGGGFCCSNNRLTTLRFGPKMVGSSYDCSGNQLTSLEFCPKIIHNGFYIKKNPIINLSMGPEIVNGIYDCSHTCVTDLKAFLTVIKGYFVCDRHSDKPKIKEIEHLYHSWGACTIPENTGIIQATVEKNILARQIQATTISPTPKIVSKI